MTYKLELTKRAARELAAAPKSLLKRLDDCILGLAGDPLPHGVKKLKDSGGMYRVRVGDYRVVYRIEEDVLTILVIRVGHRREVYR
jgi:mRNA interferase RelE/StbE